LVTKDIHYLLNGSAVLRGAEMDQWSFTKWASSQPEVVESGPPEQIFEVTQTARLLRILSQLL